jgi:signal transduction histidine kinase
MWSAILGVVALICFIAAVYFFRRYQEISVQINIIDNRTKALWNIEKLILNSLDFNQVTKDVVNEALKELSKYGYSILVLSLIDPQKGVLKRISISSTEQAKKELQYSPIPFGSIEIPLGHEENSSVQAIKSGKFIATSRLADLLTPVIRPDLADEAQKSAGIKASLVFPVTVEGRTLGTMIFSMSKKFEDVTQNELTLLNSFTDLVGLAIQNSKLYTSVQQTTQQLAVANEKLKQLDQLKDDFVSIASHELRTPMTAIRSYSWMALNRSDIPLSGKLRKYLERTLLSTERLINLVNDMLNISRIESGQIALIPTPFNVAELVNEVISEVEVKAKEKQIHLEVQNVQLPQIFADPDKVHQVLLNLIGNSLKFTHENGHIRVNFFSDGQNLEVAIRDDGVGISKEDQSRLFTKFGRLEYSYVAAATSGGTGLGLYICKSLIELMHGRIWAVSEGIGKGTTFIFSLPVASQEVLKNAAQYAVKPSGGGKALEPVAI